MLQRLLPLLLILSLLLFGCTNTPTEPPKKTLDTQKSTPASLDDFQNPLGKSEDMGQKYIDSFVFVGESTTYHLKNRGVLLGGTETTQVWGPKSGTMMLDISTALCRIVYPETGEEIDISEAMARRKPEYILLTFGLNGAPSSISKGAEHFKACYKKLIDALTAASPSTAVILGACFPIAQSMDMSGYSVDAHTLNSYIDKINGWTYELASECKLAYLNTAECLKNSDGFLFEEYQVGDGYHLTRDAYLKILDYIRTHAHPKEISK